MYKCQDCSHLFEDGEQKKIEELVGEYCGSPAYNTYYVCPICGGDYNEVQTCELCGNYDELEYGKYCKKCVDDIKTRFELLIGEHFDDEERELLREVFDGEMI